MRLLPLNQQVVVVVGASSGIGRATALCLAAQGASVVVSSRNRKALDSLAEEIRVNGGVAVPIVADASDAEQMRRVADRAVAALGRIDTWVHVAAVSVFAPFEQTKPEEFRRVVEVNLLGQVHGAQAALPHLKKNGGALIHVSSVLAKVSVPFNAAYVASKHGIAGFIDALRLELRREGAPVSVTQILPAGINTPLYNHALTRLGVEPRPPAPVYQPELVARAIAHAAQHPVRDLVVGGGGMALLLMHRLSPRLVDAVLVGKPGFEARLTDKPRSDAAPNNLHAPITDETPRVRGDFSLEARSRSLPTRLTESVVARAGARVTGAVFSVVGRVMSAVYALRFRRSMRFTGKLPLPGAVPEGEPPRTREGRRARRRRG